MHLVKTKPAGAFPVADRSRDGQLYETEHPRLAAIRHLREAIADGRAGLDPYDETIFLVDARDHERVWTNLCLELCGLKVGATLNWNGTGIIRYRGVLEADVRQELGLDSPGALVLRDEPLASRMVDVDALQGAELRRALDLIENPRTPVLRAVADARNAQQRAIEREVH